MYQRPFIRSSAVVPNCTVFSSFFEKDILYFGLINVIDHFFSKDWEHHSGRPTWINELREHYTGYHTTTHTSVSQRLK